MLDRCRGSRTDRHFLFGHEGLAGRLYGPQHEIGIFLISISGVELLWNVGMRFLLGVDNVELGVELDSVVIGLMVICLSQFFDYGTQLQQDVDGLL